MADEQTFEVGSTLAPLTKGRQRKNKFWLDGDWILWPHAYESSMLPQSSRALWRIGIDLQHLKKTLTTRFV
jgi:hypothetical protein